MRHKEYSDILFNKNMITHKMKRIYSKLNRIGTYVYKIYLCRFTYVMFSSMPLQVHNMHTTRAGT